VGCACVEVSVRDTCVHIWQCGTASAPAQSTAGREGGGVCLYVVCAWFLSVPTSCNYVAPPNVARLIAGCVYACTHVMVSLAQHCMQSSMVCIGCRDRSRASAGHVLLQVTCFCRSRASAGHELLQVTCFCRSRAPGTKPPPFMLLHAMHLNVTGSFKYI